MDQSNREVFIGFINPMGYGTLGEYDKNLIANFKDNNVIYYTNVSSGLKEAIYEHVETKRIFNYSRFKAPIKGLIYFLNIARVVLDIRRRKGVKVIHIQWLKAPSFDVYWINYLRIRGKCKVILTAHNLLPHSASKRDYSRYRRIYHSVDRIIVHSDVTKAEMINSFEISNKNITVIPHGSFGRIQVDPNEADNRIKQLRAGLGTRTVFCLLGRLSYYKGVDLVVNAWKNLSYKEANEMHLIIAGEGDITELDEIRQLENTTIVDRAISDLDFHAYLSISDFVLLPYREISQSGFLLTVLSYQKQIIVSNKGGLTEPFLIENVGYILSELSPEAILEKLKEAHDELQNPNKRKLNWEGIDSFYSWESIATKTENLYDTVNSF